MDPREGEGFCLARATKPSSGTLVHVLSHSVALHASIQSTALPLTWISRSPWFLVLLLARAFGIAGEVVFAVITYKFPILSAKAVPDLQNFLTKWVVNQ